MVIVQRVFFDESGFTQKWAVRRTKFIQLLNLYSNGKRAKLEETHYLKFFAMNGTFMIPMFFFMYTHSYQIIDHFVAITIWRK